MYNMLGSQNVHHFPKNPPYLMDYHGHVITGDLRLIKNDKLRKLLTKGPNFREPQQINLNKYFEVIKISIDNCVESLYNKTNIPSQSFLNWRNHIVDKVKIKIESLKHLIKFNRPKQVLKQKEVLR